MSALTQISRRPAPEPTRPRRRSRTPAWIMLALLLLTGVAAVLPLGPSSARSGSAPATRFSAQRALTALDGIATQPHPSGSPAQAKVRAYLLGRLRDAGTSPRELTRVAGRTSAGVTSAGRVTDIYATVPGTRPTGTVLLVAHYDSVPTGPGASDDGSNVAAVLEILRVLRSGPRPRNDIGILLTDGEEQGLLGAQAFVDSGVAGDPRRVVAVNLEARGTSGPAVLFQTVGGGLAPAVRASGAYTTSLADEIFGMLPNDTDLTALGEAGVRGLNFAFFQGAPDYHTPHDSIDHVSGASVQSMGDAALGAVRQLAGADLTAGRSSTTYFAVFGTVLSYPERLVLPLACLAGLCWVLLLWRGRRRGLCARGTALTAATLPLTLLAAAAAGFGGWWVLSLLRPEFALTAGAVYRPGRYLLGESLLLLVALTGWYRLLRRRVSALDVAMGVLGWFWALGALCAVLLPGGSYLFTWPALIGTAAVAAAVRLTDEDSCWRTAAAAAAAVPATALVLPLIILLLPTLGLSLTVAPLVLAALLGALALTLFEPLPSRRALTAAMAALAVLAVGTVGVGSALDGYSGRQPRAVSLGYVLDADTKRATWVSEGGPEQPVVGRLLTDGRVSLGEGIPLLRGLDLHGGTARAAALEAPRTERVFATERDGVRTVRARLRVPAGTHQIVLYADTSRARIAGADLDGARAAGGRNLPAADGDWRWTATYAAPAPGGVDLTVRFRGAGALRLRVVAVSAGLPAGAGAPALPSDVSWAGWPSVAGQTLVVRTLTL
ncbi:M20/M25/M40 family metallo-hydrolase [Streptomyces sp. NPDC091215]|uniref:M20/M25/M40 family metallo-hydrolase n=1 Tax=Streptomyces sp. NPDC091215 TaxID=3155192 RepID=UPI0034126682